MKKYRQAVSALVIRPAVNGGDSYELLLVHKPRKNDAWQLPQGGIEEGESYESAARRELMEEAGIDVGELLLVSEAIYTYDFPPAFVARHKPTNNGQTLYFVAFSALPDAQVHVDRQEIDQHVWVVPQKVRSYVKRPEYADFIDRVYAEAVSRLPFGDHATH